MVAGGLSSSGDSVPDFDAAKYKATHGSVDVQALDPVPGVPTDGYNVMPSYGSTVFDPGSVSWLGSGDGLAGQNVVIGPPPVAHYRANSPRLSLSIGDDSDSMAGLFGYPTDSELIAQAENVPAAALPDGVDLAELNAKEKLSFEAFHAVKRMSQDGLNMLKGLEGYRGLEIYRGQDSNNMTWGWGHKLLPGDYEKITAVIATGDKNAIVATQQEYFDSDVREHEDRVYQILGENVVNQLSQNQFDALVMATYNGSLDHSMITALKAGNLDSVYFNVSTVGGVPSQGVINRNGDTYMLYKTGLYDAHWFNQPGLPKLKINPPVITIAPEKK